MIPLARLRDPEGRRRALHGAAAGAVAAGVWALAERPLSRVFGTDYTDVRLLGRFVTRRRWRPAGIAVHTLNGVLFGTAFALRGSGGAREGVIWANVENVAAWPGMAVMDRLHPDRRSGRWPRLVTDRRVFAQETVVHVLFGALLGRLVPRET